MQLQLKFVLLSCLTVAHGDVTWSDGRVSLRFDSSAGGCLKDAVVLDQGGVLASPLSMGIQHQGSAWSSCGTPARVDVLYNGSDALRLRTVQAGPDSAARLETLYSYDAHNATLGVVLLLQNGGAAETTRAKQPYDNGIFVSLNARRPSLPSATPFVQDGEHSSGARCGFRTVGVTDAISLRWDRPKMTACSTSDGPNATVQLQLAKYGFTPRAGELWRLDYAVTFGAAASRPYPADEATAQADDSVDVTLPVWLLPSTSPDKSQWWPGDGHKLALLRSMLPQYQVPLLGSKVGGCPTRFFPLAAHNATTGAPIHPGAAFCQTFDGPTAAIAMARMGLRSQAVRAIDAFTRLVGPNGSLSDEFNMYGEVQNKGTLAIAPAEYILAVWSYWSNWNDEDAELHVARWMPAVERSAKWLISQADPITGWTCHSENSFAPASAAVNGLTAAYRLCHELVFTQSTRASCNIANARLYLRAARRASILPQGLSSRNASQMRTAYAWFSPLKAAIARDEYTARWYTSIWPHFTGSGGSRNNDGGSFAAGETSELSRSVFWNMTEQRRLMHGMYEWAWVDSSEVGVGGFIDTEHRWIPLGYSDRALWSMAEPAIYLTSNFSQVERIVIQPHAVSPITARVNQTVTVVVQERRGHGVSGVRISYLTSCPRGRTIRLGPFAMEAGGSQQGYTWRHIQPVRSLTPTVERGADAKLHANVEVRYVIVVRTGDGSDVAQVEGSFLVV